MSISILSVGRMQNRPEAELFAHYQRRIRPVVRLIETADGTGTPLEVKRREAVDLLAALPKGAFVVPLDQAGTQFDSPSFAAVLDRWLTLSRPICFIIGGAEGLDISVINRADIKMSLGAMTWPHFLARAMLAEQIFRARSISTGHPYHRSGRPG